MKDLIRKYRKIFIVFSLLILSYFVISLYISIKYNLDYLIKEFVRNKLEYNIEFTHISPKFSNIRVNNFVLKDKDNNIIIEAPSLDIKFNFKDAIRGYLISDIILEKPNVYLEVYNYSDTNITEALNIDFSVESNLPLKEISIVNGKLYYKDKSYTNLIQKEFVNLNGGLTLIKNKLDLYFEARVKNSLEEKLGFYIKDTDSGMDIRIVGENINIDDSLLQYAYDDEGMLEYKNGIANIDLTIYSEGLKGYTYVQNASLRYEELISDINSINLEAYYDKKNINLYATGKLEDNTVEFNLTKLENSIDLNFKSKNLNSKDLFKNINILSKSPYINQVEGIISYADISLIVKFAMEDGVEKTKLSLNSYLRSDYLKYNNSSIEDFRGELSYDFDKDYISFSNLDFKGSFYEFEPLPIKSRFVLNGNYDFKNLNLNYNVYNEKSFFSQKTLNGNLTYNFQEKMLILNNDSSDLNLDLLLNMNEGHVLLDVKLKEDVNIQSNLNLNSKIEANLNIDYNYKTRILNNSKGNIILKNSEHYDYLELIIDESDNNLIINNFLLLKNNSKIELKGKADLKDLTYQAKIENFIFNSKDFYRLDDKLDFKVEGNVEISGKEKDFDLLYDLYS